tara:strand:+ start:101 stop:436 length:336 start_codon:yes stop_codon:yes gene_type:complete
MTFIYLGEDKKLIHYCKACDTSEPFTEESPCIYSMDFRKFDTSEIINQNKYITHDITLPKIEGNPNIKCTNDECISIKENMESSVTYIKYDAENMKYIYICNHCGQKWKNN